MSDTPLIQRAVFWAVALAIFLLLAALIIPTFARVSDTARRSVDAANLRQIGQSMLIYANNHEDRLPVATDIWDYARSLADDAGLDGPRIWLSSADPAGDSIDTFPQSILLPGPSKPHLINPAFRELKPSVAVALGKLNTRMPATTPIAWTRGLQPNGTWSAHSPYGKSGGYITFLGGNVAFFKALNYGEGELVRFDGKGQTANILEAIPPGTRIGEYTPTPDEQQEWAEAVVWTRTMGPFTRYAPLTFLTILWLPFIAISVCRLIKKRPGAFTVLLWPVAFTIVLFFILPGCW
ncbi:MAG: hypothetical protein ACAH89_08275 [Rariglobus sp.]|nr:hypothetical protein [Rariglobus sp.]